MLTREGLPVVTWEVVREIERQKIQAGERVPILLEEWHDQIRRKNPVFGRLLNSIGLKYDHRGRELFSQGLPSIPAKSFTGELVTNHIILEMQGTKTNGNYKGLPQVKPGVLEEFSFQMGLLEENLEAITSWMEEIEAENPVFAEYIFRRSKLYENPEYMKGSDREILIEMICNYALLKKQAAVDKIMLN